MDKITGFIGRLSGWLGYRLARALAPLSARLRLKRIKPERMLILCYGNIYRSPFVEYYLNSIKPENLSLQITSAGFHDVVNRQSQPDYIDHCQKWGVDLSEHRSRRVTGEMLEWADIIVIMDGHNYKMVKMLDPEASSKLIWLGALSNSTPVEIADPYAKSVQEQEQVVTQLAEGCRCLIEKFPGQAI